MKIRNKFLLSIATVAVICATTLSLTSCSGISKDILNNLVSRGDGTKFGSASWLDADQASVQNVIQRALTDPTASKAFKKNAVNQILYNWYKNYATGSNTISEFKKNWTNWTNSVNDDYKSKVQSYKDSHKSNWSYYFQNEVLDPVGGTEAAWKLDQMYAKIRNEFLNIAFKDSHFACVDPSTIQGYYNIDNTNIAKPSLSSQTADILSYSDSNPLAPQFWDSINFYTHATDTSQYPFDDVYRTFTEMQWAMFDTYLQTNQPISTAMCLWKYSAPSTENGLKDIYNADIVDGSTLSAPNLQFPYFDHANTPSKTDSNIKFAQFGNDLLNNQYYWNESYSGTSIPLKLINIKYSDVSEDSSCMFLLDSSSSISDSFETYGAVLFNDWLYRSSDKATQDLLMPAYNFRLDTSNQVVADIMKNFLFTDSTSTNPAPTNAALIDLTKLYKADTSTPHSIDLFNPKSTWYTDGYYQLTNSFKLTTATDSVNTPFILIRNDTGVHAEAIDGVDYLANNTSNFTGTPWSRERENALLKFRTYYEENVTNPIMGKGIDIITKINSGSFKTDNLDDAVLWAVQNDEDFTNPDHNNFGLTSSIWKSFTDPLDTQQAAFTKMCDLIRMMNEVMWYQTLITNYEAANKKLIAYSEKFVTNAIYWGGMKPSSGTQTPSQWKDLYANGLSSSLPLQLNSGKYNADINYDVTSTTFDPEYLSFYDASTIMIYVPKMYQQNTNNYNPQTYINAVNSCYQDWYASLNTDQLPIWDNNQSGSAKYSEHIITRNAPINSALNAIGTSNTFVNIIKSTALANYLGSDINNYNIANNSTMTGELRNAIVSQYLSKNMINDSDKPLTNYFNAESNGSNISFADYKQGMVNQFLSSKLTDIGYVNKTSDGYVSYFTFLATLKYLSDNNNSVFINYLRSLVGGNASSDLSQNIPSYIAWTVKDNYVAKPSFQTSNDVTTDYDWKTNYNGMNETFYRNNDLTSDSTDRTYTTSTNYWNFAAIPNAGTTAGMGFVGLINTNNTNGVDSKITDALFKNYPDASADNNSGNVGGLYQYTQYNPDWTVDVAGTRINILSNINNNLTTPAAINNFAKNISAQVRSADFDKIYQAIQSHDSLSDKKKYLNFAFQQDPDNQYPMLDASYYQGINGGNANNKLFRVKDGNDYMFKPDSTVPTGVKAVAVAINLGDLGGEDSRNIDYASVSTHLQTVFGKEVFYNLLVQAAMDSMRQSEATRAAIKAIGKINVYDRRWNDLLGQIWVDNYKDKN